MRTSFFVKTLILVALSVLLFACRSSRSAGHPHGMPPGHAKKVYGHRSARAFAPGQRKKKKIIVVRSAKPKAKGPAKVKGKGKGKKH